MESQSLFLTLSQAIKAICLDFKGYGPQPMLYCEVLRTIHQGRLTYSRDPGQSGLWVSVDRQPNLRWLEGQELVEYMCAEVTRAVLANDQLATLCRLVFQAPCCASRCPESGRAGVYIQTAMETFVCRQCGQCCTKLNYQDGITADDVQKLKDLGRDDVLKWVGTTKTGDGQTSYRMWVLPGTNQFATICPFLINGETNTQKICAIHDVKPQVCRNYPVSRKHARMTGCMGFDK